jgi:hypothetical protein
MVRNRATNNKDFVPPTQYSKLSRRMKKKLLPALKLLPDFKPLPICNKNTYNTLKLLYYINSSNPY